jgi:hypothetical protein
VGCIFNSVGLFITREIHYEYEKVRLRSLLLTFHVYMCGPVVQVTTKYYAGQKILAVIVCHFKKSNCNPYFIVIMITVLIMNVIFWVVNFKTRNYFVIFYYTERLLQVIYVQWRAKKSDTSNSK